jgi:hypothetical protein
MMNLLLILNIKTFVVVGLKRMLWRKIRDPCDLIGLFRYTGFFATQGRTLLSFKGWVDGLWLKR